MAILERKLEKQARQGLGPLGQKEFDSAALKESQAPLLRATISRVYRNTDFYREKLAQAGIGPDDVRTVADLAAVPFTTKDDLRAEYPLGLMAVPEEQVVRIHSSSGTTGVPVIIPYTARDVEIWAEMMARCFQMVGVTKRDRVQVTPGYGLWTAGIGFQAGVERLGAMAIPMGPGNTEKQLRFMRDLGTTVLIGTASYGLLLAEEVERRGLKEEVRLRIGVFGSERWGDKMRERIREVFGFDSFDIYGLTEIYGPGIGIDCPEHAGIHYWSDHLIFEVIDPVTGKVLPEGEQGELVITTITKEGMPLIRYRTHEITRLLPGRCPCGSPFPMIDRILGRSDDMFKIKGVNIYPGQIDYVLQKTPGAGSEYQIVLDRNEGKDTILIRVEAEGGANPETLREACRRSIKTIIGIITDVEVVPLGALPRSEKKTKRVLDNRQF
jgi:phenylacetate-CoA ligase